MRKQFSDDEAKSLMQDNLWDAGWFELGIADLDSPEISSVTSDHVFLSDELPLLKFGGESFLLKLSSSDPNDITAYQPYSKVMKGEETYLSPKSFIFAHKEKEKRHMFFCCISNY